MEEIIPENRSELNQICLQCLRKTGERQNKASLYWVQLVIWALERRKIRVRGDREEAIRNFLEFLDGQEPNLVMRFLGKETKGFSPEPLQIILKQECDPVELAWRILDLLDSRMRAEVGA